MHPLAWCAHCICIFMQWLRILVDVPVQATDTGRRSFISISQMAPLNVKLRLLWLGIRVWVGLGLVFFRLVGEHHICCALHLQVAATRPEIARPVNSVM